MRQISVPTTIAGGEFSAIAGVTNEQTKVKEMLRHAPGDAARGASSIPRLTVHTPEWLWLSTGIRAVDHCVEGTVLARGASLRRRPGAEGAFDAGAGAAAREGATPAISTRGWIARSAPGCRWDRCAAGVPMGASHGIGYVLGAVFDVPHGYTLLRDAAVGDALEQARRTPSGRRWSPPRWDIRAKMPRDVLDRFIRGPECRAACSEVKVGPSISTGSREQAMRTPWIPRNPRKIEGPAQVREIFWSGRMRRRWRHHVHRQARSSSSASARLHHGEHRRGGDLSPSWRRAAIVLAHLLRNRGLEAARPLCDLHGEQQPLPRGLRRRRAVRHSITPASIRT